MSHAFDDGVPRYPGLYGGTVIENVDPDGRYRIKAKIQGLTARTAWAVPLGTMGGGSAQRGGWIVPDIGADVDIMFLNGDIERPRYACSGWSLPAKGSEMPVPARDVPPAQAHQVPSLQLCGGRLSIYVDERPGSRKLVFADNDLGDAIVWDLEKGGLSIKMTSAILLQADGLIRTDALQTQIGGRIVDVTPKPI